jgi:hypothetical protein
MQQVDQVSFSLIPASNVEDSTVCSLMKAEDLSDGEEGENTSMSWLTWLDEHCASADEVRGL